MKFRSSFKKVVEAAFLTAVSISTAIASNVTFSDTGAIFSTNPPAAVAQKPRPPHQKPPVPPPTTVPPESTMPTTAPINLIKNGVFVSELSQWLVVNNVTAIPGRATINPSSTLSQNIVTTVGVKYRVRFDVLRKESIDPGNQGASTSVQKSNVAFKLNQLTPIARNGEFDSYAFDFIGTDRTGSNAVSVPDILTFSNSSQSAILVITNVSIGVVK